MPRLAKYPVSAIRGEHDLVDPVCIDQVAHVEHDSTSEGRHLAILRIRYGADRQGGALPGLQCSTRAPDSARTGRAVHNSNENAGTPAGTPARLYTRHEIARNRRDGGRTDAKSTTPRRVRPQPLVPHCGSLPALLAGSGSRRSVIAWITPIGQVQPDEGCGVDAAHEGPVSARTDDAAPEIVEEAGDCSASRRPATCEWCNGRRHSAWSARRPGTVVDRRSSRPGRTGADRRFGHQGRDGHRRDHVGPAERTWVREPAARSIYSAIAVSSNGELNRSGGESVPPIHSSIRPGSCVGTSPEPVSRSNGSPGRIVKNPPGLPARPSRDRLTRMRSVS